MKTSNNEVLLKLHRFKQSKNSTQGVFSVLINEMPVFFCCSLERGWRNNENRVSCIPIGEYFLEYEMSNAFKTKLWEIKNSGKRTEVKIHVANFWKELEGCIALGLSFIDMDNDKEIDVTYSRPTISTFHRLLKPYENYRVKLVISGDNNIF